MPFGLSISCVNFQSFLDALKHIVEWKISVVLLVKQPSITNYLDDFLFIAISMLLCNNMVNIFLQICEQVGCPISMEKMEWAQQLIVFLGILLNGKVLSLSIPMDKRLNAIHLLKFAIS